MSTIQVWQEMHNALQGFVMQQVQDEHVADDILQEVFLKMETHIHQLRDENKVQQWLYQIARNAILDHFRQAQKRQAFPSFLSKESYEMAFDADLNEVVASWIPGAIALLPEKYREAVFLSEIKGLSQKELAKQLDLSYSGAKSRVQRGRAKLKDLILECCEVQTDRYGNVLSYRKRAPNECCD